MRPDTRVQSAGVGGLESTPSRPDKNNDHERRRAEVFPGAVEPHVIQRLNPAE
jgi:hypothetical protein